jgi:hypothetical protein
LNRKTLKTLKEQAEPGPDLTRAQSNQINVEMSMARDALYRAAYALEYGDPFRSVLWELAGDVEDAKIVLMRRCHECGEADRSGNADDRDSEQGPEDAR